MDICVLYDRVYKAGSDILGSEIFQSIKNNVQHQHTNTFDHSVSVAIAALYLKDHFHIKNIDEQSLIRGCLLHDFFLYDWHITHAKFHGFTHPTTALRNAMLYFNVNSIEADIIKHHMFPLTPHPPTTKEGWIITIADKIVSIREVFHLQFHLPIVAQLSR